MTASIAFHGFLLVVVLFVASVEAHHHEHFNACFDLNKMLTVAKKGGPECKNLPPIPENTENNSTLVPDNYEETELLNKCFMAVYKIVMPTGAGEDQFDIEEVEKAIKAIVRDEKRDQVIKLFDDCKAKEKKENAAEEAQSVLTCYGEAINTVCETVGTKGE